MKSLFHNFLAILLTSALMAACTYDEGIDTSTVAVRLSEPISGVDVIMTNTLAESFVSATDASGTALFSIPAGIYSASVSQSVDKDGFRTITNGSMSDIVVNPGSNTVLLSVTSIVLEIGKNIVIKELYVGGCQKDDGSGWFAIDKAIILYNNSPEPAPLDNLAIGIIEPYNAEASIHSFLADGILSYADDDWIPAINGIWYFRDGHTLPPYTELVINVYGAIDNTLTYSNSVNFANPEYFCMYDVEATSSDGGKYNNTIYYPSPSEVIPTSHYLKAVKYGQANAWPISMFSPAVILFRPEGLTPAEFGSNPENIIYPADKQGNIIYACLKVPRSWVVDAVEVFNAEKLGESKKRITPDLDNGYVSTTSKHEHAVVRKIESWVSGYPVYQDTNNSSNDFYEADKCSLR